MGVRWCLIVGFFPFKQALFFRGVLGSHQNRAENAPSSCKPSVPTQDSLIHFQHSTPKWYICDNRWILHHYHPKSTVSLVFILGVVHCMGFDKCRMTCIHHYIIIQSNFTALNILYAQPIHPSYPPLLTPVTTNLFTVSIVLPFLECHIVGIGEQNRPPQEIILIVRDREFKAEKAL